MPAYDCKSCTISYPASRGGGACPICGTQLAWNSIGMEDATWEDQVLRHKGIFRAPELPALNVGYLAKAQGQTWIAGMVLQNNGYPGAEELDIIRVAGNAGDLFFELVGRTTHDVPGTLVRGWLIEQVDWKDRGEELTPAMFTGDDPFDGYTGGD